MLKNDRNMRGILSHIFCALILLGNTEQEYRNMLVEYVDILKADIMDVENISLGLTSLDVTPDILPCQGVK